MWATDDGKEEIESIDKFKSFDVNGDEVGSFNARYTFSITLDAAGLLRFTCRYKNVTHKINCIIGTYSTCYETENLFIRIFCRAQSKPTSNVWEQLHV